VWRLRLIIEMFQYENAEISRQSKDCNCSQHFSFRESQTNNLTFSGSIKSQTNNYITDDDDDKQMGDIKIIFLLFSKTMMKKVQIVCEKYKKNI
jgi:hypothetical protein